MIQTRLKGKKFKVFLASENFKNFKEITDTVVHILNLSKTPVLEYSCESFYAYYMPHLAACLFKRHAHNDIGHYDINVETKFVDIPSMALGIKPNTFSINKAIK